MTLKWKINHVVETLSALQWPHTNTVHTTLTHSHKYAIHLLLELCTYNDLLVSGCSLTYIHYALWVLWIYTALV